MQRGERTEKSASADRALTIRPDACRPQSGRRGHPVVILSKRQLRPRENRVFARLSARHGKHTILTPFAEGGMSAKEGISLSKSTAEGDFPRLRTGDAQARQAFSLAKRHFDPMPVFPPNREKESFSAVRSAVFGRKIRRKPYFSRFSCGRKKCFLRRNENFSRHENGWSCLMNVKNLPESLKDVSENAFFRSWFASFDGSPQCLKLPFPFHFACGKEKTGDILSKGDVTGRNEPTSTGNDGKTPDGAACSGRPLASDGYGITPASPETGTANPTAHRRRNHPKL